ASHRTQTRMSNQPTCAVPLSSFRRRYISTFRHVTPGSPALDNISPSASPLLTVALLYHPAIPSIQATRPVVLCVEDDPAQLLMLHKILSLEGFQVLQATTAEEALDIFREAPVSLVC